MIFRISQDKKRAHWNEKRERFVGDRELIEIVNLLVSTHARIGSNGYTMAAEILPTFGVTVDAYEPDVYPEGTLDV
jgi:hypothetical protein